MTREGTEQLVASHWQLLNLENAFRLERSGVATPEQSTSPWWHAVHSAAELPDPLVLRLEQPEWATLRIDVSQVDDALTAAVVQLRIEPQAAAEQLHALRERIPQLVAQPSLLGTSEAAADEVREEMGGLCDALWRGTDLFWRLREEPTPTPLRRGAASALKRFFSRMPRPGKKNDRSKNLSGRCGHLAKLLGLAPFRRAFDTYLYERLLAEAFPQRAGLMRSITTDAPRSESAPTASEVGLPLPPTLEPWEQLHSDLRAALEACHSRVFTTSGPSPHTHTYALAAVPANWMGPEHEMVRARILQAMQDKLDCTCRLVPGRDGEVWIYYESLFHSPCEIRNLPTWKRAYKEYPHRERLHIDVRWLSDPQFTDLCPDQSSASIGCGNAGCGENIISLPRGERRCPGCGQAIRSRCGNPKCKGEGLHQHPRGQALSCPHCGELNHAAWWLCSRHGKREVTVAINKARCPECIRLYQQDSSLFPASCISKNPFSETARLCPNCERLAEEDPAYRAWSIPRSLQPFTADGVNGHDLAPFLELARRHQLPETVRCPQCRTLLIPIHHRELSARN